MQFLKCVKLALLVSGATFAITSFPAAKLASERLYVQLNRTEIFSGDMRDLSGAYFAIAGLMSLSFGLTGFSLAAWRQTGVRLKATKLTVEELEALVQQREQQLQAAQLAPMRLQQSGLNAFLEDDFFLPANPATRQLPTSQATPFNNVVASKLAAQAEQQRSAVSSQAAKPVLYERQLSPSQASQLQAVQAQMQQQSRQARSAVAARWETASDRTGGFTVINPYQVQPITPQSRQHSAASNHRMA